MRAKDRPQMGIQDSPLTTKPSPKPPSPKQQSRQGSCLVTLSAIAALMGAVGIVAGGIWLSLLLMLDPGSVVWLNKFLPAWTRIPITTSNPAQTLSAIREEIKSSGMTAGNPIALDSELLVPLLASPTNCYSNCEQIVELRVYQLAIDSLQPAPSPNGEKYYQLVTSLAIANLEESFVVAPLGAAEADYQGASDSLPLTQIRLDDTAPASGIWLNLSGQLERNNTPITYGQIVHYNPSQSHLSVMLQWTSPTKESPYWQAITGEDTPELIVNQTVGLEPRFKIYQIQPRDFAPNPIYLEEISLAQPALDLPAYRDALTLSSSGLWSLAKRKLQTLKSQKDWSVAAQAQLDVIGFHAQLSELQAQESWATPAQQITASLIDGRWAEALLIFQATAPGAPMQEIAMLLKSDSGRLGKRVEAALAVNAEDYEAKSWGALMRSAQQGRDSAIAWLKQSPTTSTLVSATTAVAVMPPKIAELLDHLNTAFAEASNTRAHLSQIVGAAEVVSTINSSDWVQPDSNTAIGISSLSKEPQQVWYQVQVGAFNDSVRWQQPPFTNLQLPQSAPIQFLWRRLGLDVDPRIQVTVWTTDGRQDSTMATVQAIRLQGGNLQLLAVGEPLAAIAAPVGAAPKNRPLAHTDAALQWIEPGSITIAELNKLQPQWASVLLPTLWRELVASGQFKSGDLPSLPMMLQELGHWTVRPIDLTGNKEPEALLTLYEDLSGALKKPDIEPPTQDGKRFKARTLIFSDTGGLLYSEFSKNAATSLTAIADLGDGGSPALVVDGQNNYNLKRWSTQSKRFE